MQTFETLLLQNDSTEFLDINIPWLCANKICSNCGDTYFIEEIMEERQFKHSKFYFNF